MSDRKIRHIFPIGAKMYNVSVPGVRTMEWNATDNEGNFNIVSGILKTKNTHWRWNNKGISYNVNSNGLRLDEEHIDQNYDFSDKYVVLGCSFVEGIGLPEHETIPAFIEKQSGVKTLNFGNGGTGCDVVFYNAMWLSQVKNPPKKIFILWPAVQRFSYFSVTITEDGKNSYFARAEDNSKIINPFIGVHDFQSPLFNKNYKQNILLEPIIQSKNKILWQTLLKQTWGNKLVELDILDNTEWNQTYMDDEKSEIFNTDSMPVKNLEIYINEWCGRDIEETTLRSAFRQNDGRHIVSHYGWQQHSRIASWFLSQ